jgi:hypothetical protein
MAKVPLLPARSFASEKQAVMPEDQDLLSEKAKSGVG